MGEVLSKISWSLSFVGFVNAVGGSFIHICINLFLTASMLRSKPLEFYTVAFTTEAKSQTLLEMVRVARTEYASSGRPDADKRCANLNAIDSVSTPA